MILQRLWAGLLGLGFLVVGVLRFIPIESVPDLSKAQPVHGLIHLTTGAALVCSAFWDRGSHAEVLNRWVGLFYIALGLLGLPGVVLYSDNATHLFVGIASSALGWASPWSSVWRRRSSRFRGVGAHALSGLLALSFVLAGGGKLVGLPKMVEEFTAIGVGQWLRFVTGGLELGAAVGILFPRTRRWASAILVIVMVGAIVVNLGVLHRSAISPAVLLVLALVALGTTFSLPTGSAHPVAHASERRVDSDRTGELADQERGRAPMGWVR
jgi:putative oxidoreductase